MNDIQEYPEWRWIIQRNGGLQGGWWTICGGYLIQINQKYNCEPYGEPKEMILHHPLGLYILWKQNGNSNVEYVKSQFGPEQVLKASQELESSYMEGIL